MIYNIKPKILVLAIVPVMINFQPNNAPVPSGYIKDIGQAYNDTQDFGWVREDSLGNTTPTPLDIQLNARDRNQSGIDRRLNTLIHIQYPANSSGTAVKIPAAWEYALPNGSYNVTVSVGDASNRVDSNYQINIEGRAAISGFVPTGTKKFTTVTQIDIIVLTPGGANLDIINFQTGITGFTDFNPSPLDLVENPTNGYLYVTQLDQGTGMGKITLVRPLN